MQRFEEMELLAVRATPHGRTEKTAFKRPSRPPSQPA
jgi:hypothetical protein